MGKIFLRKEGRSWSDSSLAVSGMPDCFIVISYHFFLDKGMSNAPQGSLPSAML